MSGVYPNNVITNGNGIEAPRWQGGLELDAFDQQLIGQLVSRARSEGLRLTGEGGLLGELTKRIIESAAEGEMDAHLGYARTTPPAVTGATPATGARTKTVLTDIGPVELAIPRDREGNVRAPPVRCRAW